MKKLIAVICISMSAFAIAKAQDPSKTNPDAFKVILNNKQVRVIEVRMKPGAKTQMHSHPNHLICAVSGGTVKFTTADGKSQTTTIKPGQAVWHGAETHSVENVGKTELHSFDIELKK